MTGLSRARPTTTARSRSNSLGTVFGGLRVFTTPAPPDGRRRRRRASATPRATLNGSANPNGADDHRLVPLQHHQPGHLQRQFGTRAPTSAARLGRRHVAASSTRRPSRPHRRTRPTTTARSRTNTLGDGVRHGAVVHDARTARSVTTLAATSLTATTVTLNGSANPNGATDDGWFRLFDDRPRHVQRRVRHRAPPRRQLDPRQRHHRRRLHLTTARPHLTPGTTYYYCAIAYEQLRRRRSARCCRSRRRRRRTVTTAAATAVTATTATLNGWPTRRRARTTGWFRYSATSPGTCNDTFGTRAAGDGRHGPRRGHAPSPFAQTITGARRRARPTTSARSPRTRWARGFGAVSASPRRRRPTVTTQRRRASPRHHRHAQRHGEPERRRAPPAGSATAPPTRAPATTPSARAPRRAAAPRWAPAPARSRSLAGHHRPVAGHAPITSARSPRTRWAPAFGAVAARSPRRDAPAVTTSAATLVTSTRPRSTAPANPNGAATTGWFRYSTTNPGTCNDTFGTRAPASGGTALGAGTTRGGLLAGAHRPDAGHDLLLLRDRLERVGTGFGAVLSFTTPAARRGDHAARRPP